MKKLSIIIRAKIATAVVDRLLKNMANSTFAEQRPESVQDLATYREDMEQDVMIVLDQKRWWK